MFDVCNSSEVQFIYGWTWNRAKQNKKHQPYLKQFLLYEQLLFYVFHFSFPVELFFFSDRSATVCVRRVFAKHTNEPSFININSVTFKET